MADLIKKAPFLIFVFLIFPLAASGQSGYGITAFGTDRISATQLEEQYGQALDQLIILYDKNREDYKSRSNVLAEVLKADYGFNHVNIFLLKDYVGNVNFIIDFVEEEDAAVRLNFRAMQYENLNDPVQLITRWNAYETLSFDLFEKGEIKDMSCPVFHCIWSFNHPDLKPFLSYFETYVPEHEAQLTRILHHSDAPAFRAAAAFLLAHADVEAAELVKLLLPAVRDPASGVRNNSMRVIYYVVRDYEGIEIDIDPIIQALDYPSFTDRNKALVILRSLPLTDLTDAQRGRMTPILLEILEKKDAHNYSNAHRVLKKMSGRDYAADDIAGWKKWANEPGR